MAKIQTRKSLSISARAYERAVAASELAQMSLSAYTEKALDAAIRSGQHAVAVKEELPRPSPPPPRPKPLPPEVMAVPMRELIKERPAELDDLMLDDAVGSRHEDEDW